MFDMFTNEVLPPIIVAALVGGTGMTLRYAMKLQKMFDLLDEEKVIDQRKKVEELEHRVMEVEALCKMRKEENTLIIKSLQALTSGLKQLGCNGNVIKADEELKDFLLNERN
jgi:hypothetical protein